MLNNMRGSSLIFVVSLAIILNLVFATVYMTINATQRASGAKKRNVSSLALAEAGKEKLYAEISTGTVTLTPNTRTKIYTDVVLGTGSFDVSCSTNASIDTVWIRSWGRDNVSKTGIGVIAAVSPLAAFNALPINAALTSRPGVELKGNITVDGRDHDTNGVYNGTGVYGVSTCGVLDIGGSSQVGGTAVAPGKIGPSDPRRSSIAKENIPVPPELASPETVLGLPAGALDKYKVTTPTWPFHGIQYVTNSCGPLHVGNSSGILIVHTNIKSANAQFNTGTFKGLVIVDEMDKLNGTGKIVGAAVVLSDFAGAPKFGNGYASVLYSSYVINNLSKFCGLNGKKVNELSWTELKSN